MSSRSSLGTTDKCTFYTSDTLVGSRSPGIGLPIHSPRRHSPGTLPIVPDKTLDITPATLVVRGSPVVEPPSGIGHTSTTWGCTTRFFFLTRPV